MDEAIDRYGLKEEDVMNKGLKIYTTLDTGYQSALQDSFEESWNFPSNASDGTKVQGASVAMDPKTGAVRAIVGGRGQHVFRGYNRATADEASAWFNDEATGCLFTSSSKWLSLRFGAF